eukprot:m.68426 g.68426  ORF g.68426 m.68426 type:complete len:92 (-) comp13682_c0_seq4:1384-1659(-)
MAELCTPTRTARYEDGLQLDTFYLECLAQASYLVSHEGHAFLIDPRRDVEPLHLLVCFSMALLSVIAVVPTSLPPNCLLATYLTWKQMAFN